MKATLIGTIVQVKLSDDGKFCDLGLQQEGTLNGVRLWGFTDAFGGDEPSLGQHVEIEAYIQLKEGKNPPHRPYLSTQYKTVRVIDPAGRKLKTA